MSNILASALAVGLLSVAISVFVNTRAKLLAGGAKPAVAVLGGLGVGGLAGIGVFILMVVIGLACGVH